MRRTKSPEIVECPDPEMLTPAEIENLRRKAKEHSAYGRTAFKNHKIDLGAKDDADFDTRADESTGDAPPARVDPAAQEQPGTVRADREGRDRAQEDRRAPREAEPAAGSSRTITE